VITLIKTRAKLLFLVALATVAAVNGGGFFDQWFRWL